MAATAILRSQDCLQQINTSHNHNPIPIPIPSLFRQRRIKRSPIGFVSTNGCRGRTHDQALEDPRLRARNLVMGQVKILKRGEQLKKTNNKMTPLIKSEPDNVDLMLSSTERLGPDPETVKKQLRVPVVDAFCAVSASFVASPPPSSLPLPAFFKKGKQNDAVTSDLRRLLRI